MVLIPPINSKGSFVFAPPFDTKLDMGREYTVTGIRSIVELFNNSEKPFEMIYKPVGLTEEDFNSDIINNVPIIVLSTDGCDFIYIPANKITSIPIISGVKYAEKILAVSLKSIPIDMDLTLLANTLIDITYEITGIKANVSEVISSSTFLVPTEEDKVFRMLLANRIKVDKSYKTRYEETKVLLEEKNKIILQYEECFKKKMN